MYSQYLECINLRLEHFYGKNDNKFPNYIIESLINKIDKIDLTKGEQQRSFVYIDDVVCAYMKVLEGLTNSPKFTNYDVLSDEVITIKDFVLMAARLTNNKDTLLNFGAIPYRENEEMFITKNNQKLKNLGWKCKYTLEAGIKNIIREVI